MRNFRSRPIVCATIDPSDLEHAKEALVGEEKVIQSYTQWAASAEDPDLRSIFEHLRGDEQDHAETLRYYLENAKAPTQID